MLLSELLDEPSLGLRLLHAAPESLARPIGRVVTTDLLEPGRYLSGGELVITGLVWRRRPEDSERFVASVAGKGATTLLAGSALLGEVPGDLLEACRRHDVTLVFVPVEVAFADITEHIAARDAEGSRSRASASLVRQREMLSAIASGRSLDELADRVSTDFGSVCRVLTPCGRHVVAGPGELGASTLDRITSGFLTADRLPATVGDGDDVHSVFPVGSALGQRLTTWLVVVDGDHRTWSQEKVDAVGELCAIAALDRSRQDEGRRALWPVATDALALVESGAPQSDVLAALRLVGLDADVPVVVVVAELTGSASPDGAAALLEDVALSVAPPVLARSRDGLAVALLPSSPGVPDVVRTAFARFAPGLARGTHLAVGLSGECALTALSGALEEAKFAHRVAGVAGSPVAVVGSEDVTSHVLLLATVPDEVRRTYAQRVLGAVLEHDRKSNGGLIDTLAEFLACSGSWSRTAESMHLHVNTVRYRIDRVQQLTGRDLSSLEDRVDVYLALKSLS